MTSQPEDEANLVDPMNCYYSSMALTVSIGDLADGDLDGLPLFVLRSVSSLPLIRGELDLIAIINRSARHQAQGG